MYAEQGYFRSKSSSKTKPFDVVLHILKLFSGNYSDYMQRSRTLKDISKAEAQAQKIVLQNRLSEIIGKLSAPSKQDDLEALDREYHEILHKLREASTNE
jgi:macrolide transport system ATP-binding/permease protein